MHQCVCMYECMYMHGCIFIYVYVYNACVLHKDIKCIYVKDAYMYMICRSLECNTRVYNFSTHFNRRMRWSEL